MTKKLKVGIDTFEMERKLTNKEFYNLVNSLEVNRDYKFIEDRYSDKKNKDRKLITIKSANGKYVNADDKGLDIRLIPFETDAFKHYKITITVYSIAKLFRSKADATVSLYFEKDREKIKSKLDSILKLSNLGTLEDFKITRIDYAVNVSYRNSEIKKQAVIDTLKQLPPAHHQNERQEEDRATSLYEKNKNVKFNIYDKKSQLIYKKDKYEKGMSRTVVPDALILDIPSMIRYEIQNLDINYIIKNGYITEPTLDQLFNDTVAKEVFTIRMKALLRNDYDFYNANEVIKKYINHYNITDDNLADDEFINEIKKYSRTRKVLPLSNAALNILKELKVNQAIIKSRHRSFANVLNEIA